MGVAFVPGSHCFFTTGKDGMVKYWDGDNYKQVLDLPGHVKEVWCAAVSNDGEFLLTGSADRSLRCWERTQEPVFLEEEEERRLEGVFEEDFTGHVGCRDSYH